MKIAGNQVSIREVVKVKLPRVNGNSIELTVCGVPIGFNADYELVYPRPRAPSKTINHAGGKTTKEENYDDPAFLTDHKAYEFYKNIYMVYRGLLADSSVMFDSLGNKELSTKVELIAIGAELKEAGFSEGDIGIIIAAIHKASHIDEKEIEAATNGF